MKIKDELQDLIRTFFGKTSYSGNPGELYDPIVYTMELGGKRIRPFLVLAGCRLFGGDPEKAMPAAHAIELFHNFTLLHDDIMDNAPLRRGKETVYKKWNTNIAILSGDAMFALACEQLSALPAAVLPSVLAEFTGTARKVCEGQQYDMNFETRDDVILTEYVEMIRLKTAVLLGCSLKLGAIVAGADPAEAIKAEAFGEELGIAFQLQDDLLDTFGDTGKFGKEIGGDILAAKKTFLLLKAFECADINDAKELRDILHSSSLPSEEKILNVKGIYNKLNVRKFTEMAVRDHYEKALAILKSIDADDQGKSILREFAGELVKRDF